MVNYIREEKDESFMFLSFFSSYGVETLLITETGRGFFFNIHFIFLQSL